eukprot:CAMPEP_0197519418 /NCGR_PEP_ID=MMETSP1318-20131121/4685_1 /TAXON_ID=552666 /ORGANISM="Partenskyella glossopodia, Strain RCC365" /LENGTH=51 /DNA_ID=CAMNT_0043070385 /DNA_START=22 /DNA_END=173 /DNA_ORIENTATION=-
MMRHNHTLAPELAFATSARRRSPTLPAVGDFFSLSATQISARTGTGTGTGT